MSRRHATLSSLLMTVGLFGCTSDPDPKRSPPPDVTPDIAASDATEDPTEADAAPDDTTTTVVVDDASDEEGSGGDTSIAEDAGPTPRPWPEPGAFEPNRGPGGPVASFTEEQLGVNCAWLTGGEQDVHQHHNLLVMYDGYLLMPWAPEWGQGGLTFWEFDDPCNPVRVGGGFSRTMRETHAIGFSSIGGRWAVTASLRSVARAGIEFWDVSDPTAPRSVSTLELPDQLYPDAYARVVLSTFWQAPYVYVAGTDNGLFIVDASDPTAPRLVAQHVFDPVLRAGQVQVVGNLLYTMAAEQSRTALLDVSDPANPVPVPNGEFDITDGSGQIQEAYFSNTANGYIYYARKSGGGGIIVWDIRDPSQPAYAGDLRSNGNGGYVFVKDEFAFVGESSFGTLYDLSDLSNIREVRRFQLVGDLDTVTPIGNVAVVSVDDKAEPEKGTSIAPWQKEPDTVPPRVTWAWPADGATGLATTSRFGFTFNEMIDVKSAWEGSVRMWRADLEPELGRVDGWVSAQENIVNFWPMEPLEPGTSYVVEIAAGGVRDFNGNAIVASHRIEVRTAGTRPD